jgi:hypothetical protein
MDPKFFRKYADLITEAETVQLDEGVVDSLKAGVSALVNKVSSIPALVPYYKQALAQKDQLVQVFQSSSNVEDLKAKLTALADQSQPVVSEAGLNPIPSMVGAGLSVIASGAAAAMAQAIGIYQQMGQPDLIAGSHLNAVGGVLFGIIPPLMALFLATIYYSKAKGNMAWNKEAGYTAMGNKPEVK